MPKPLTREQLLARVEQIAPHIDPIQGWLAREAGYALYHLAYGLTPTPLVVELGSWKGRSTGWLGRGAFDREDGARVVAVDTWAGTSTEGVHNALLAGYGPNQLYEEFLANMARLGIADTVEPWRMTTLEAAAKWNPKDKIGVLHIDASHEYIDVRNDFEAWAPHVAGGGFVVFDDVPSWQGPSRLVAELPRWFEFNHTTPNQWTVRKRPA